MGDVPGEQTSFVIRPDLLAVLDRTDTEGPSVYVLTGAPGSGKSQLAAVCARARLAAGWPLVAWINAESVGSLLVGLATLADAIGLRGGNPGTDVSDLGRAVKRWLEADGHHCLLVFDGAQDNDSLRPFVPASGAAQVLITSSQPSMAQLGSHIPVGAFKAEQARAFLAGRTGLADIAGSSAVAAELEYLPFGLALAGAVISGPDLDYHSYLKRLRAEAAGQAARGSRGLVPAVLLSVNRTRTIEPAGLCTGVIEAASVMSAPGVRRELLYEAGATGALSGAGHRVAEAQLDGAIAQLAGQSLLTLSSNGQAIIVNPLVARVVREGLARQGRLAAVGRGAALAVESWAGSLAESSDRAAVRAIPQQITALLENTRDAVSTSAALVRVLLRLRFLMLNELIKMGDSGLQAIAVGESLTADLERLLGPHHPDTLSGQDRLTAAYHAAGRVPAAAQPFEQALPSRERLLDADQPGTVSSRASMVTPRRAAGANPPVKMTDDTQQVPAPAVTPVVSRGLDPGLPPDPVREALATADLESPGTEAGDPPDDTATGQPAVETTRPGAFPEPGIPWVESSDEAAHSRRRPVRVAGLAGVFLGVVIAGSVAIAWSGHVFAHHPDSSARPGSVRQSHPATSDAVQLAAEWVSQQVSPSATVACDPLMCSALEAQGVPAGKLLILRTSDTSLLGAEVVVATPVVRSLLGRGLDSQPVIAGFGSGPSQVNVMVVAKEGVAAYRAALSRDMAARTAAGRLLLANRRIAVTAQAATQLAAGEVDSRMLILLPALAAGHPIQILAFGDPGPAASPGVPLRSVDLSGTGKAAGMADVGYVQWLTSFIGSQSAPFAGTATVAAKGRQPVVHVVFGQPSPLGLLPSP